MRPLCPFNGNDVIKAYMHVNPQPYIIFLPSYRPIIQVVFEILSSVYFVIKWPCDLDLWLRSPFEWS